LELKAVRFHEDVSLPGNRVWRSWSTESSEHNRHASMKLLTGTPFLEVTIKAEPGKGRVLMVPLHQVEWCEPVGALVAEKQPLKAAVK